jgi:hypothetical protein
LTCGKSSGTVGPSFPSLAHGETVTVLITLDHAAALSISRWRTLGNRFKLVLERRKSSITSSRSPRTVEVKITLLTLSSSHLYRPHPGIDMAPSILKVNGTKIVDGDGKEVILRGAGLGGWMKCVRSTRCLAGGVKR